MAGAACLEPANSSLPQQPVKAGVQLHLGQEPLCVYRCPLRSIRSVPVEHQFGCIEQKLFRRDASMDGEKLKTGALIEVEAKVHMLNLSTQQGSFQQNCGNKLR